MILEDTMVRSNDEAAREGGKNKYFRDLDLLPWYAKQGLVPGGEASQKWLKDNGFRTVDGQPNARKAWEFVAGKLGIEWTWENGNEGKGDHYIAWNFYPRILGPFGDPMQPSLADLVRHCRGDITLPIVTWTDSHERELLPILAHGDAGKRLSEWIRQHGHKPPKGPVLNSTADWLVSATAGAESDFFLFVCPDWATQQGRYTFSGLGTGVGLVAQRALNALPHLWRFCQESGIANPRFTVAIGDFEGDSEAACSRIGIDSAEFRYRCRLSQEAFAQALEVRCPEMLSRCSFPFATELAGGITAWQACLGEAREAIAEGLEKSLKVTSKEVAEIVDARRSLYERWYGEGCDARAILSGQLPEYGALGAIAMRVSRNPLIVGIDHAVMSVGFQILAPHNQAVATIATRHNDY